MIDFRTILSIPSSLKQINAIRDEVIKYPEQFDTLYDLIFENSFKHAWRAAWTVEKIIEIENSFITEKKTIQLMNYATTITSSSLLRSVLAILINLPIPRKFPVVFLNMCFEKMLTMKEAVAVQALSIKMACKISESEPDFIPEIILILENIDTNSVSAGYNALRTKTLKYLYKKVKS